MADDIQGALPTVPAGLGADPEAAQKYTQALSKVAQSLEDRNQTNWFDIAAGFLKPTRGGGFGESAGYASEAYGKQLAQQQAIAPQLAMMKAQLAGQEYTLGNAVKLKNAQDRFIADPTDKQAIADIARYDPKGMQGVIELSKSAPKVRSLLSGNTSAEVTPFDVLASDPDQRIASQARILQSQYKNGLIDDEKGAAMANQMLTLATNNDTKRELHGMMAGVNAELIRARTDKINQEMSAYLSPQQKIDYQKIVQPAITESNKAITALDQLGIMEGLIKDAPSGVVAGYAAKYPGAIVNTKANTALRELDAEAKKLITYIPRLPGSQSNFDAKNLLASLGDLSDPKLDYEARMGLLKTVREGFEKLADRGFQIQNTWEQTKTLDPILTNRKAPVIKPDSVSAPTSVSGTSKSAPTADVSQLRAQAAEAISQGGDPIKIKAAFKSMTGKDY
jgi:hypothetical protein